MSKRDDLTRVRYMLDAARTAAGFLQGKTREDLAKELMLQLAVVRLVEIIGEAAGKVSAPTRRAHPEIPWVPISDTRNRLIHGYDRVDLDVLWAILHDDLPVLITQLEAIVGPASD